MKTNNSNIIKELRKKAINASENSYSPYSKAQVGAALITGNGLFFSGTNVENSSFGATICAERSAIFNAISCGERVISKLYIYSKDGWSPCGMCRQVISEFANSETTIIIGNIDNKEEIIKFFTLFPNSFSKKDMDIS